MKKLVFVQNNQALTDSRTVAEKFKKEHFNVVRDIRNLIEQMAAVSQPSNLVNVMFRADSYQAEEGGRRYPMYLMNHNGFLLLAMGFTGKKALQFKLKFIDAFNKMEAKLAARLKAKTQSSIFGTPSGERAMSDVQAMPFQNAEGYAIKVAEKINLIFNGDITFLK